MFPASPSVPSPAKTLTDTKKGICVLLGYGRIWRMEATQTAPPYRALRDSGSWRKPVTLLASADIFVTNFLNRWQAKRAGLAGTIAHRGAVTAGAGSRAEVGIGGGIAPLAEGVEGG